MITGDDALRILVLLRGRVVGAFDLRILHHHVALQFQAFDECRHQVPCARLVRSGDHLLSELRHVSQPHFDCFNVPHRLGGVPAAAAAKSEPRGAIAYAMGFLD